MKSHDLGNVTRLNIGAGTQGKKGFTSVDIEEKNDPDILGDFREMEFENLHVIRMFYLLEHFGRAEGIEVLRQLHSWLKPGGELRVAVPDFEGICKNFATDPYWMTRHAFGSQEAGWAYHLDGWYEEKFRGLYGRIGFNILGIKKMHSRKYLPNLEVIAEKIEIDPEVQEQGAREWVKNHPNCPDENGNG